VNNLISLQYAINIKFWMSCLPGSGQPRGLPTFFCTFITNNYYPAYSYNRRKPRDRRFSAVVHRCADIRPPSVFYFAVVVCTQLCLLPTHNTITQYIIGTHFVVIYCWTQASSWVVDRTQSLLIRWYNCYYNNNIILNILNAC